MIIYSMAPWGHGEKKLTILNLKKGLNLYHSRPFPVPKVHEHTLKVELDRLVKLKMLKQINASKWAAPTFVNEKKDATIRFISDFRELNKCIKCKPFPIPKIQDLLLKLEGFQHATSLNLNMGYYHIELMPVSKRLCTIIMPWGKYNMNIFLWVFVIAPTSFKSACLSSFWI